MLTLAPTINPMSTQTDLTSTTYYYDFGENWNNIKPIRAPSPSNQYMHFTVGHSSMTISLLSNTITLNRLSYQAHNIITVSTFDDGSVEYKWYKNRFKGMPLGKLSEDEMDMFLVQALKSEKYNGSN